MSIALSPTGHLHLGAVDSDDQLPPAAHKRIASAFARGEGFGLLQLALTELSTRLPPDLAFVRELGRAFLTAACAQPDLEELRGRARVAAPEAELDRLARVAPPMAGAEYLTGAVLERLWGELAEALSAELSQWKGSVQSFLHARSPVWNLVGRVCFHLAENKRDEERPFAFLATYAARLSADAKVQHRPLGQAVRESGAAADRKALLSLLVPVEKAAEQSALVKELVDSGDLFQPLAWTAREAYRFLKEIPQLEAAGVVVRIPDWWRSAQARRPQVSARIGNHAPSTLGTDALLDFSVSVTLGGQELTEEELRALRAATDGLQLIRGRWVEIDRQRLDELLDHFRSVQKRAAREGLSFFEGMRLLAGASEMGGAEPMVGDAAGWSQVLAGDWLTRTLAELREPGEAKPPPGLCASLRPYQKVGLTWLRHTAALGLGACLADDMGLGKTIQVLALLLDLKRRARGRPHLLVAPASLIANWQLEIERFAPSLSVFVAHPSALPAGGIAQVKSADLDAADLVIATYGTVARLPLLTDRDWELVILDEAQAIKNPEAKQTRACKALRARARVALTGTPVENRLGDLWSIFDFLNPGLLGSAKTFGRFAKRLAASEDYAPLRNLVRPYILRRLKTDRSVIADLPDKTEVPAFCALSKIQATLYQDAVDALRSALAARSSGIERRGTILAFLLRFKQLCNHPSQWLKSGDFAPEASGKLLRLREICEEIAARQEKALVFTQFREMTEPLAGFLGNVFAKSGLVLHGGTPVKERQKLVERFQSNDEVPFFVLSVKAGGTGLNLTAASHVIHFDRWWNPAVEDQATDRAYRIGQKKNVLVHKLICRGTVEERIDGLIESKRGLSRELLEGGGEKLLTELGDRELLDLVSLDIHRALAEA